MYTYKEGRLYVTGLHRGAIPPKLTSSYKELSGNLALLFRSHFERSDSRNKLIDLSICEEIVRMDLTQFEERCNKNSPRDSCVPGWLD
jgi:hypothetical protein